MKCLGLLGIDDLDLTAAYGKWISEEIRHRFGHRETCRVIALSMHGGDVTKGLGRQNPKQVHEILKEGADSLIHLGAEAIVPCSSPLQAAAGFLALEVPGSCLSRSGADWVHAFR
jgi:aspartate/glutamate racemase